MIYLHSMINQIIIEIFLIQIFKLFLVNLVLVKHICYVLELLTPNFLDYEELYVLSSNIHQKEYQFLKKGFEKHFDKKVLLEFFPRLNKFRKEQFDEVFEIIENNLSYEMKQNNIRTVFTSVKEDLPTIQEMNDDTKKLFVFDDLSGDKEFRENIRRFFSKGRPNNCQAIYLYTTI